MNRKGSHQNEYLLNIVALCVVLFFFTPLGAFLQISSIAIYDEMSLGTGTDLSKKIGSIVKFLSTYLPAIAYIVSLGAAIIGFIVEDEADRKTAAITSFVAGGAMIVFGILMFVNPGIPILIFFIGIIVAILYSQWGKN